MTGASPSDETVDDPAGDLPTRCALCDSPNVRRPRFYAAFPERDGEHAAFPIDVDPPVASWRMVECATCGAVRPLPYPAPESIEQYYASAVEPNDWEVVHYVRKDLTPGALDAEAELADKLTRLHGGPGRLLEVGCAAGWQLRAAREVGWQVQGIEAAPKFSRFVREEQGIDVFEGTLGDVDPATLGTFDAILLFDVFEHLYDPTASLRQLRALSRPGTVLLLTTPDISSPLARFWGLRWRQILPSHINYSTPRGMKAVLRRTGWRLDRVSEPRYYDPDPRVERRRHLVELGKFIARTVLYVSVIRPSTRLPGLKRLPPLLSRGRVSWDQFLFSVGDQPVLGDVMMVVARST